MSSHFKYEIDERNLRLQLKENELSFTEEAWQKFESFSATQKHTTNDAIIKRFHVSLNRNVVLPVVFAVVIIMFSLLLFNFINIKNPNKQSAEVAPQQAAATITEIKDPVVPPAQVATAPVEVKDSTIAENTGLQNTATESDKHEIEKSAGKSVAKTTYEPAIIIEKTKSEIPKTSELVSDSNTANLNTTSSEEVSVKKKRRNKRQVIVTEPTQEEAEQLPPPPEQQETPQ